MATPRQRRKGKSGSSNKPSAAAKRHMRKKLVRAPEIKGPDVLKQNWDPKLTVRQNYAKLGLLSSLAQHESGGLDRKDPYHPSNIAAAGGSSRKGMARIIRDAEGNVVDVIEPESTDSSTPWGKPLHNDDDDDKETYMPPASANKSTVVEALKDLEAQAEPVQRFTSEAETNWLLELVQKYGQDTDAMAKDRTHNPWQKTAGEIRRAIKKAGGFAAFQV